MVSRKHDLLLLPRITQNIFPRILVPIRPVHHMLSDCKIDPFDDVLLRHEAVGEQLFFSCL